MENHLRPMSLFDAWLEYEAHLQATLPQKKADALLAQTRTALMRYTLPGWGFPLSKGQRLTAQEREQGLQFMEQVGIEQLTEATTLQEKLFGQLDVAGNSQRNYRWALNGFIDWCKQQPWSVGITWTEENRVTSPEHEKNEHTLDAHIAGAKTKRTYRLSEEQVSASLQKELDVFRDSLTHGRRRVSEQMAQQHERQVLRLLGWLHQVQGISVKDLSLERLVSRTPEDKEPISSLVQSYLQWLRDSKLKYSNSPEHASLSPYTAIRAIDTWIAVAKFVYREEIGLFNWEKNEKIPVFEVLYDLRRRERENLNLRQTTSRSSEDVMSWPEFLEVGEALRSECKLRFPQSTQSRKGGTTRGAMRSLTAIAQSYQRFLCVALLSYIPPARMQEVRELRISLPAVSNREQIIDVRLRKNLLYQDDDGWWISIAANKTGSKFNRIISLPNIRYENNSCFYQYLKEWLLHYEYQDDQGETLAVPGLRSCFNPQHDYLFTLKSGRPYSSAAFRMLLNHSIHRVTEKPIASVRRMFLNYIQETSMLSPKTVRGLETRMGYSSGYLEKMLIPSYKPRKEDELLIEEIVQAPINEKYQEEASYKGQKQNF